MNSKPSTSLRPTFYLWAGRKPVFHRQRAHLDSVGRSRCARIVTGPIGIPPRNLSRSVKGPKGGRLRRGNLRPDSGHAEPSPAPSQPASQRNERIRQSRLWSKLCFFHVSVRREVQRPGRAHAADAEDCGLQGAAPSAVFHKMVQPRWLEPAGRTSRMKVLKRTSSYLHEVPMD